VTILKDVCREQHAMRVAFTIPYVALVNRLAGGLTTLTEAQGFLINVQAGASEVCEGDARRRDADERVGKYGDKRISEEAGHIDTIMKRLEPYAAAPGEQGTVARVLVDAGKEMVAALRAAYPLTLAGQASRSSASIDLTLPDLVPVAIEEQKVPGVDISDLLKGV
jgi:hypothetical protein